MGRFNLAELLTEQRDDSIGQPRDIETITAEILAAQKSGGECVLTIGRGLLEAKKVLPHGEWQNWMHNRLKYSERTAQGLMQIARIYTNPQLVADLGVSKAIMLLALPEEVRNELISTPQMVGGEEKTAVDMTRMELKAAIKERDEALKAAEQAKAEQRAADDAREKMAQDVAFANERLAALNNRTERYAAEARELQLTLEKTTAELEELRSRPVEVAVEADPAAVKAARKEAEAAMKSKLDKAKQAKSEAEEALKAAEDAKTKLQQELDQTRAEAQAALAQAEKRAALASNEDFILFRTIFEQVQADGNKLVGLVMRSRNKNQKQAEGFSRALLDWLDKLREAVTQ